MTACPICARPENIVLEQRGAVPVAQNLILPSREQALQCATGALDIRRCTSCGFTWNCAFDPRLMAYDTAYDNDQNFSARFRDHVDEIAAAVIERTGEAARIDLVEVGCGQGSFLKIVAARLGRRLHSAIGFDPAWRGDASALPAGSEVRGEYFGVQSRRAGDPEADIVVSRHVIEHVPDPLEFLRAIRAGMRHGTPLVIETPNVDWILANGVFFDFYYEHCSLFTPNSLAVAMAAGGFAVEEVRHVFDGQYLLAIATAGAESAEADATERYGDLGYLEQRNGYLRWLSDLIETRRPLGKVALWGGASKGVTICLTLDNAAERIDCVIDINNRKQGCYLPTSGIAIVSPADAWTRGVRSVLVVNPAYLTEIRALCREQNLGFELVSADQTAAA